MATSFIQFDSADMATLEESITHSKENPFLMDKFSDKLRTTIDGEGCLVNEPANILSSLVWMLEPFLVEEPLPDNEKYMPERTSKRLYNSHDFWFVLMLINGVAACSEYNLTTIKLLQAKDLHKIEIFLAKVKGQVSAYGEDRDVIYS